MWAYEVHSRNLELAGGASTVFGPPCGRLGQRLSVEVAAIRRVAGHVTLRGDVRVRVMQLGRSGRLAGEVTTSGCVADERRVRLRWSRVRLTARPHRCSNITTFV